MPDEIRPRTLIDGAFRRLVARRIARERWAALGRLCQKAPRRTTIDEKPPGRAQTV